MTYIGVLIPADNDEPIRRVEYGGLESMQAHVGGDIQAIDPPDIKDVTCYIHEEGKVIGLPFNSRAQALVGPILFAGDSINGDMLVCGWIFDTDEYYDLPEGWEAQHLGKYPHIGRLPEPDRTEKGNRSIEFAWKLRAEGEKTHYAVLSCGHQKAGMNFMSGRQHGSEYYATLRNQDEEEGTYGKTVSFMIGSGVAIMRKDTTRFNQKQFEDFASSALGALHLAYAESNPKVLGFYQVEHGASLGAIA
jgi:hypothetical protein